MGAGAAGLSLACHLADAGWGDAVLLVDDGSHPIDRRSWAWWTTGGGLLDPEASIVCDRQWVVGPGWRRAMALTPYSYRRLTGPQLSAAAERIVGSRRGYRRASGTVRAVVEDGSGCRVTIDLPPSSGALTVEISARWVFDSVGVGSAPASAHAAELDFLGLHVECPGDTFDQGAVTLMDFRTDQSAGVSFIYVLPTSPRSALVERTTFVVTGAGAGADDREAIGSSHEAHVRDYLLTCLDVDRYQVVGREAGTIPLERHPPATAAGSQIPIGARAGMVKASTGYGFERIQRHSKAIATLLSQGRSPADAATVHRWSRALDAALLRVIRDEPARAVEIFAALLTRNPAPRILAFLDEDATLRGQFLLFATLPLAPFARAQCRAMTRGRFPRARDKR
ncbi:MAG: lycopene beta cyclase [Demequinaceae bacterium]|nr:lycopene beta cyclase [Demequinaceae bacterium]